jgi:hypothetical protein
MMFFCRFVGIKEPLLSSDDLLLYFDAHKLFEKDSYPPTDSIKIPASTAIEILISKWASRMGGREIGSLAAEIESSGKEGIYLVSRSSPD